MDEEDMNGCVRFAEEADRVLERVENWTKNYFTIRMDDWPKRKKRKNA